MKNIIVGTAGHIDHGKSALVEALTGTHPDRLEEEKRRGITIDLGFAFLELDGVKLGFVDVPGHERFVKNMLAGVGGIDVLMLIVAADESIKPQTREHFDICRLLEIKKGLVALTKSDLVDADTLGLVRLEIEEFLRGSFLEGAAVLPVSSRTGAGLEELKAQLLRVAESVPPRNSNSYFRLPVDRVFAMKGFGTVVTGTLLSGFVKPEDEAELLPSRRRVRVRGVQSGGASVALAEAGQRTAINLAGIEVGDAARGMVLAAPGMFEPTRRVDARVSLLPAARALKSHARAHFHQGTAEIVAEVVLLDRDKLEGGDSCFAQLRLGGEALLLPGDRFILRQFSPVITIGGGVVLDNLAPRHARGESAALPLLSAWETGNRQSILLALAGAETGGATLRRVIARSGWPREEIHTVAKAAAPNVLRILRGASENDARFVPATHFARCVNAIRAEVKSFHQSNPLAPGISREELRARAPRREEETLFRAAIEELISARELEAQGEILKRAGRDIEMAPEEIRAREQIEQAFARAGLAVPPLEEALSKLPVEKARARKLLQLLWREQVLVKVTEDLTFHRVALARLRELLAAHKKDNGERISVPAFKELTGISRKYAIPLLEYLDRNGVTRRVGDERIIL